jgi:putative phosphoserine phosphatase / 1-acylglycerol-3-phosphate O-acyltransferase
MARSAAFFDLDRTILPGGSGPVFAATLARLGVKTPHIPGQELLFKLFDIMGESYLVMQLAKQAASRSKGLDRAMVQASAEVAADTLMERVQPYAPALFEEHRAAGDLLVLATTSPYDLVAPFARRLGFDAVVATRYGEVEGIYTGELNGLFVWGPGKLAAIRMWAEQNDVSLETSSAYSDSVFDAPMLGAVGHPVAVNPDYRLRALAALRRWPVRNLDAPAGVPSVSGIEPFDIIRTLTRPEFFPGVKFRIEGVENVPRTGAVIIASNHRSYFDPLAIGLAIAKAGRNGRFMGKKEVFDAPIVGQFAKAMGAIRVDRGTGSDAPLKEAAKALDGGEVVVILPEGTIPRGEAFFDPILKGKKGTARLAAMTGASIVPLGIWGTEKVWPRSSKVPSLLRFNDPHEVILRFGPPVALASSPADSDERSIAADTEAIMAAIMDLLPAESRIVREVSAEELAKTTPDGRVPSAGKATTLVTGPASSALASKAALPKAKSKPKPPATSALQGKAKPSAPASIKGKRTDKSAVSADEERTTSGRKTKPAVVVVKKAKRAQEIVKPAAALIAKSAIKAKPTPKLVASSAPAKSAVAAKPRSKAKPGVTSSAVAPSRRLRGTLADR